jgi:hypothetical protein
MRLLDTKSLELSRSFVPTEVPDYAIFSHRWSNDEVIFSDISSSTINLHRDVQFRKPVSFAKIQGACRLARTDGYDWIWIDSCCIDKSSSAELQEAINSMWRYYAESNVCYVYLADVPDAEAGWGSLFTKSTWFTRGWTLQELIAPTGVEFYSHDWAAVGTKCERHTEIAAITSIHWSALLKKRPMDRFSTAEKLSWAAHRIVTKDEDEAYSLLGLFDVNMPLLYGEGRDKAFVRLQEIIYNTTADQSIFLYRYSRHKDIHPLLADSPMRFCDRIDCASCLEQGFQNTSPSFRYTEIHWSNIGLTQTHEQIMTTCAPFYIAASTVLPLLVYEDVAAQLEYFDHHRPRARVRVTHIAVLNFTLEKYPDGALCLLLRSDDRIEEKDRIRALPAILPELRHLESHLQKTRILFRPMPSYPNNDENMETVFSFDNAQFRTSDWGAKWSISHSVLPSVEAQHSEFKVITRKRGKQARSVQLSCNISDLENRNSFLTLRLTRMKEAWSINQVVESEQSSGNSQALTRTLFKTVAMADRCSCTVENGEIVSIKLRRLPGSARTRGESAVAKYRYHISVDYR